MKRIISFILSFGIVCFMLCTESLAKLDIDLGTIMITANRLDQDQYRFAGNVTVITKEQIQNSNAQTIPDILQSTPGVNIYDFNTTKTATLDIRGFGDSASRNTLVLVNGRRINTIDGSGADLVQIPVEAVERIEIIRGAGSVLYGDNAVGGVVNIITKKGEGKPSGKIGGVYGSYDTQGTSAEVSGEHNIGKHNVSYYLYSKYLDKRGYRQNSDELHKDFNMRLSYGLSDNIEVDLEIGRHNDTYDLPGGLDVTELANLGRRGSADGAKLSVHNIKQTMPKLKIKLIILFIFSPL